MNSHISTVCQVISSVNGLCRNFTKIKASRVKCSMKEGYPNTQTYLGR